MMTRAKLIRTPSDGKSAERPETKPTFAHAVKPFVAATAVVATGALLVIAIFFTLLDLQWVAFLTGVMFSAILAMVTQATRAERRAMIRGERLSIVEYQLENETAEREALAIKLAAANSRLQYFDTSSPVMLAFVDTTTRYLYHNYAFRRWLGLSAASIDGHHMRDVLGRKVFAEIEPYVLEVAARIVRYERTHKALDGSLYRLAIQFVPQFDKENAYAGFYVVMTSVANQGEADAPPRGVEAADIGVLAASAQSAAAVTHAWEEANRRILAAINGNEFTLFCQRIKPLAHGESNVVHYEILIRLLEEESSLIPPGAFFPLADEHGLLPQLDRWVFSHVLDWMVTPAGADTLRNGSIYFVKVEASTICDPDFPDFVRHELTRSGVPGDSVCIEISEVSLVLHPGDAAHFARTMKECGCRVAISGFGRDRASLAALKLFPVDYLKIDGSIVRKLTTYPASLGKAVAISRMANTIGIAMIAEMVEDNATLAVLRELKIDFAQGFGISLPQQLTSLSADSPSNMQ